ncbi:MAG: phosphate propanoyltransferase [Patescibacteria group bacterium]|nr:phosphate propanoyltransferase [Patescibacteria group bacterium]MCL5411541.1 phosphate propanoyltransferase [Patescibacteria group bacterium]
MAKVLVEVSARHLHLTQEHVETLFGKEHQLTPLKWLSQPKMFAAEETVTLVTPKTSIENVRVLGPARNYTQVEISRTDAIRFGLEPPIRDSDEINLDGTPGIRIIGDKGELKLEKGVIMSWRHLHVSNNQALELGVTDGQVVKIKIDGERGLIFENVLVRVHSDFSSAVHLDTDEGNAAGIKGSVIGELIVEKNQLC